MTGHRAPQDLYAADFVIPDPGAGGSIEVDRYGGIVEMVSAAAESRTLYDPEKSGILLTIRMLTDGGDITLTASNGLNVAGNTQAVFADIGDLLHLISVDNGSGDYRWEILVNTGSVALS